MPELPEVETTKRGIAPFAEGARIEKVTIRQSKLRWPIPKEIPTLAKGKIIQGIDRRGKYLLVQLEKHQLMIHLGMSGSLRVITSDTSERDLGKHDHFDIVLDNGRIIRFNDPRRFGSLLIKSTSDEHPLLSKLGVEPLSKEFSGDYLWSCARGRQVAIKSFIMNSHIVVGVGNIYAQESLFLAGIHPKKPASKISKVKMQRLVTLIQHVLCEAIKAGGSSLKDFTGADGKPGYFQQTLNVYGRMGEPCVNCDKKLTQAQIGQRTTVYCTHCQK